MCLQSAGNDIENGAASSDIVPGPALRRSSKARRVGSLNAPNRTSKRSSSFRSAAVARLTILPFLPVANSKH